MMLIKYGRMGKFLACPEEGSKVTQPMPEEAAQIKALQEKTKGEVCPICGKPMNVRRGRFGFFLGCSDYPKCKGISKIWNKTGYKCPNCLAKQEGERSRTPIDQTRPSTPSADSTSSRWLGGEQGRTTDAEVRSGQSAKLIGDIVEKKSRGRGKPFFACTRFPDCNFVMNLKPESQAQLDEAYKNWKENPPKPKKIYKKKV
jgi:DNA topoisomerase-1